MQDVEFLALLVHRGHLGRDSAQPLVERLQAGEELGALLEHELGWSAAQIDKLRRTRCGETPEIPGYEVLSCAGTGGTSSVFRVLEKKTRRTLALKVLNPEATRTEGTRKAFIAEARLLERLSHPALVKGHGVARSGNTFFSRMEFIDGETVLEILDRDGGLPEDDALRIILAASEALQYLEEQGVVHRDVKPGNIMRAKDGTVKLIDLGFAATEDCAEVSTDSAVGTVAYLSPEQAAGGATADCRSDIYSLGISLFHLIAGHLPFEGSNDREVLRMQVMESLNSPELKSRGISPHVHYFVEKMVAKDAEDRYQCWNELVSDIREQLAGRDDLDFARERRESRARFPRRRS